jgi:hypothetical protein
MANLYIEVQNVLANDGSAHHDPSNGIRTQNLVEGAQINYTNKKTKMQILQDSCRF